MKYILGIFYVNRLDLLYQAVYSIRHCWPHTVVIDNSEGRDLRRDHTLSSTVSVYEPPVPLSHSQSQNMLQKWGAERHCDAVLYMHNDAEAHEGTPEALLAALAAWQREGRRWGIAFTNLDTLAAYHMEAVRAAGPWDMYLPMYFSDQDWYRRVGLAGYETMYTGLGVTHHNDGASTVKSDPLLTHIHQVTFPLYFRYYEMKWGGVLGQETYLLPFGHYPLNPVQDYLGMFAERTEPQ
ncbi:glycosyltransferase family 2 protein [Paenibacillus sp. MER TA 81-3]|uniref:glycosyltransferase family 2 protein n=1 Tax=Paenibacillus sp. MER TA 81-3 TaxID=2939573 RepID=UPI00203F136C|nr:glycosyltransferase family 2 protein [Paenibacillus sp. MER TA 81-3]MCM3340778.1 glycosyltransferase family 2 protein [Paenibacillus sp. MER TA 81-3]